jgi:hypothetical protein
MFINIFKTALFGMLLSVSVGSFAGTFSARISSILLYEQGDLVYIYVVGGTQNRPACAGSNGDYISFSMKRPRAKEYLAGLMFAFGADKTVSLTTSSTCIDQSVSDTLLYYSISN